MSSTSAAEFLTESDAPSAADDAVFARLEADFGDELQAVLTLYLENSDALCQRLEDAMACAYWQEAVRAAVEIGHKADTLGFRRIAAAARKLADATYSADAAEALRNDAQMVMLEYERFRLALAMRFPNLVASMVDSVA
jgi:hypothetical protein